MKASCPRCGRGTEVDPQAGDFPIRCYNCGTLLRRRTETADHETQPESTRIERGMLAGLLISRTVEAPTIIHANGSVATLQADHSILRPESRRAISRARARQKALARAELRVNDQALSALTWVGMAFIVLLGLGAAALKARAVWQHPAPARADTLRVE